MNSNVLFLTVFVGFILYAVGNRSRENYNPSINPPTLTTIQKYNPYLNEPAPWIRKLTPIPLTGALNSTEDKIILAKSVDPGAHIVCRNLCENNSKTDNKIFMQVCIDKCIQEKWTNPNSQILEYKA